jgi:hypothetical protein
MALPWRAGRPDPLATCTPDVSTGRLPHVIQPDRNHLSNAGRERRLDQLAGSPRLEPL